jgi:hypothetical protein
VFLQLLEAEKVDDGKNSVISQDESVPNENEDEDEIDNNAHPSPFVSPFVVENANKSSQSLQQLRIQFDRSATSAAQLLINSSTETLELRERQFYLEEENNGIEREVEAEAKKEGEVEEIKKEKETNKEERTREEEETKEEEKTKEKEIKEGIKKKPKK